MNYNKSYFKKYDSDSDSNDNNDSNDSNDNNDNNDSNDITIKKISNSQYFTFNDDELIIIQNKIEELLLKLKFLNSNKNKNKNLNLSTNIDYNNILNNLINNKKIINNITIKSNSNQINIIDIIDNITINLNKKIITQGQIKRKNNLIEFEF